MVIMVSIFLNKMLSIIMVKRNGLLQPWNKNIIMFWKLINSIAIVIR